MRAEANDSDEITPFHLHVPDSALSDLRRRLSETRWPERETVTDETQGARLDHIQALLDHWLHRYDWRRVEARLSGFGQYRTRYSLSFNLPVSDEPTPEERAALARVNKFFTDGPGYFTIQSTRPQAIGYGLADSPVGQAAWIYEKFTDWCDGAAEEVIGFDKMLDDIMLYWLPATGAASARIYWENARSPGSADIGVPVGFSAFLGELVQLRQRWAERGYGANLAYFNKPARGGHFAAFEQPGLFTEEVRAFARLLR